MPHFPCGTSVGFSRLQLDVDSYSSLCPCRKLTAKKGKFRVAQDGSLKEEEGKGASVLTRSQIIAVLASGNADFMHLFFSLLS